MIGTISDAGGTARLIAASPSGAASARELASHALEASDGRVDILVNDAAVRSFGPTQATAEDDFDSTFAVNVKVPCFLAGHSRPRWPNAVRLRS